MYQREKKNLKTKTKATITNLCELSDMMSFGFIVLQIQIETNSFQFFCYRSGRIKDLKKEKKKQIAIIIVYVCEYRQLATMSV